MVVDQAGLPYYKQEKSFQRYARIIADAVDMFPDVITHDPSQSDPPLSVETFNSRFTYAVRSAIEFGYTHPRIDQAQFYKVHNQIKCVIRQNCCVIGSLQGIKEWDNVRSKASPSFDTAKALTATQNEYEFAGTDLEILSLCKLLARKTMSPQPLFFITNPSIELQQFINEHDVLLEQDTKDKTKWRLI
jgi:hypothetical protein